MSSPARDLATGHLVFQNEVVIGFSQRQRVLSPRWFYDRRGSALFEQITELEEYYPTRCEQGILTTHSGDMASLTGLGRTIVEFGSGSSTKTPALIRAVAPDAYIPIDISGDFLRESAGKIAATFPSVRVLPLEADFTRVLALPREARPPFLGFFPGSTIGNLMPADAVNLLRHMAEIMGPTAMLLIGIDRPKDEATLIRAYDDSAGVTARFNLNVLQRINRELHGTIPVDAFVHRALWNTDRSRIEMHLEATRDVRFTVSHATFDMRAGETIHTENSHKYDSNAAKVLLTAGGWLSVAEWRDPADRFSMYLARVLTRSDREE